MKFEDQVVSFELAQKLKALGVKQQSLFYWYEDRLVSGNEGLGTYEVDLSKAFSAFTVAELGEMLPCHTRTQKSPKDCCDYGNIEKGFSCYDEKTKERRYFHAPIEADARAKMLVHLIENGFDRKNRGERVRNVSQEH